MRFVWHTHFLIAGLAVVLIFNCNRNRRGNVFNREIRDPVLTVNEQLKDFDAFRMIFENLHPDIYRRANPAEVTASLDSIRASIQEPIDVLQFYKKIAFLMEHFGCSHSYAEPSYGLIDSLKKQNIFFPVEVFYCNGEMIVNERTRAIPFGSKIVSINGEPADLVMKKTCAFAFSDIRNDTGEYFSIRNRFAFMHYCAYGESDFQIEYIRPGSVNSQTISLGPKKFSDLSEGIIRPKQVNYDFYIDDTLNTGVMTIKSLLLDGDEGKAFKHFLKSSFDLLQARQTPNLILDLRYNTGGYNTMDMLLRSYLADSAINPGKTEKVKLQSMPLTQYESGTANSTDHFTIERYIREKFNLQSIGFSEMIKDSMLTIKTDPKRFRGKLLILINPETGSAAIRFASFMQSRGLAKIAGQTTAGSGSFTNAIYRMGYELPNSKIRFEIPVVHQEYYCVPAIQDGKSGLRPDFPVPFTQDDLIIERDPVMDFAETYFQSI